MQKLLHELEEKYQQLLENTDFQKAAAQSFQALISFNAFVPLTCERSIIFRHAAATLYHYTPLVKKPFSPPLLIVYAFINRPTVLDLQPDRSFIKKLLIQGIDIYLLDWGNPTIDDKSRSLTDYISGFLKKAVKKICHDHHIKKINLLGICQGGVFSLCYAAHYPAHIHRLITMVTPVDFHADKRHPLGGVLKNLGSKNIIEHCGNVPGIWLVRALQSLKPFRLWQTKHLATKDWPFFLRMEHWINDCPDHPSTAFHEFIQQCYQRNALIKHQLLINKRPIALSKITMPVLNIYATQDHLVPITSACALSEYIGSNDYHAVAYPGGHIGVFVSKQALKTIPKKIATWLRQK